MEYNKVTKCMFYLIFPNTSYDEMHRVEISILQHKGHPIVNNSQC
jgi:hypothetical protein